MPSDSPLNLPQLLPYLLVCRAAAAGDQTGLAETQPRVWKRKAVDGFGEVFDEVIAAVAELDVDAHCPHDFQVAIKTSDAETQLARQDCASLRALAEKFQEAVESRGAFGTDGDQCRRAGFSLGHERTLQLLPHDDCMPVNAE